MRQKAYKILSLQKKISHNKAKELIDKGLVSVAGKKVGIARAEYPSHTLFDVAPPPKPEILFQDENLLALIKPAFLESYDLAEMFDGWVLLHRLDKETSGVILLVRGESDFHKRAKKAFKDQEVYKEYIALVSGFLSEPQTITAPILTTKKGFAKSRIHQDGLSAVTYIDPLKIIGKKTLIKAVIQTGRTHQIRVHLKHIGHSIIGDRLYGGMSARRVMLHASKIKIFDYEFHAPLPKEFQGFGGE
ncbi:ribosomal pseudouridine synthase [Helicobacter mustelae]|uniref:RluA family pseudouridine synthase n=1 Tax=Helicobacter mustelae TaxID=217 RepID=UPI000DFBE9B7|nr:RluA family pseudouridine synthase [Helicobacter mustelae]STP13238.1 ribosomal pseudouridine synthase [Helicobacter mustelae]